MRAVMGPLPGPTPPAGWSEEGMRATCRTASQWRDVVLRAYAMQPALSLTARQGQRLWGMDACTCGYVLDALVKSGALTCTSGGQYCRADYIRPVDPVNAM